MFLTTDVPVFDLQTGKRVGTSDGMETFVSTRHQGTVYLHGSTRLRTAGSKAAASCGTATASSRCRSRAGPAPTPAPAAR